MPLPKGLETQLTVCPSLDQNPAQDLVAEVMSAIACYRQLRPCAIMTPRTNHEHLSEIDFLLRQDGCRQVHSRKRFGQSREHCASCAGRFLGCPVSWLDH